MGYHNTLRRALSRACSPRTLAFALAISAGAAPALAQSSNDAPVNLDLGSVLATGTTTSEQLLATPGTAPNVAPSLTPVNATQPTSVVSQKTIENQFTTTASYADIAKLTPSVSSISPNGPGLQEASGPVIRGFQDGQYNITFDGIPFGDANDFTHHSTSFFTASDIGQTIVDRGPGTAETVGDATFGGTISLRTIDPAATQTLTPTGTWGSFGTSIAGLRYDTGSIRALNGTTAVVQGEHIQSNGGLTHTGQERENFFGKIVIPLSASTTLTLMSDYNNIYQNFVTGTTSDQLAYYGWNYANNSDPYSQAFYKYNSDQIQSDMEYADLRSNLGDGFLYDGKIYTYAYYHHGMNGADVNGQGLPGQPLPAGAVPNLVQYSPTGTPVAGVPGQIMRMDERSVGTIQRLQKNFSFGDIKTGFWFDHQVNTRFQEEVILNAGNVPNYISGSQPIDRLMHDQLYTFQPYAQFDWKPINGLTLTAGAKYAFFRRQLNAPVNQKTGEALGYQHNYDKLLPSFEAKYNFSPTLSAYFQAAEGFLAPNLNTYFTSVNNVNNQSLKPESTLNLQTGFAYQSRHLALGGDIYNIHFQNYVNHKKVADPVTNVKYLVYYNSGGVIYRGIEAEATYTFDNGISLFANGGYNEAFQTGSELNITNAPQGTANLGVLYDKNGIYASVIDQWTGGEYSGTTGGIGAYSNSPASGKSPGGWYDPYNVVNLAAAYTFNHNNPHLTQVKVKLNVDNITNQHQVIFDYGTDAANQIWYQVLPGVSAFVTVSVPLKF